jgi:hypothetical protein
MLGLEEQEISLIGTNPEVHRAASWCVWESGKKSKLFICVDYLGHDTSKQCKGLELDIESLFFIAPGIEPGPVLA